MKSLWQHAGILLTLLVIVCPAKGRGSAQAAPRVERLSLLSGNKTIGVETWSKSSDDVLQIELRTDRNLNLHVAVRTDRNQVPISIESVGKDSEGNPVSDHLSFSNGRARWQNRVEHGEQQLLKPAYYITFPVVPQQICGLPGELGLLARALLASPSQKLALLPAGEARIEHVRDLEVAGSNGRKAIAEYLIYGLDFAPVPVWLDKDGALFAITGVGWAAVIREGWEPALSAIRTAQQQASDERASALAKRIAHYPDGPTAFRHVAVFDSEHATVLNDQFVVVSGHEIVSMAHEGTSDIPAHAVSIDGHGMTLLPGLWDMHTHLNENDGLLHLAAGVTAVRDLGNYTRRAIEMRRDFDQGTRLGPRVWLAGLIDSGSPYPSESEVLVNTEQEALDAVEWFHRLGYVHMKIYSQIKPEWIPAISRRAHEFGMRVGGHIPAYMTATQAVEAGFDEINHTNFLFLNFMPDVKETQTAARYMVPAERAPDLDLSSAPVVSFIQFLKSHGTIVDPTLGTYETRYAARKGSIDPALASIYPRLPVRWRRIALTGGIPTPPEKDQRYRSSFQAFLNMIGALHTAGVPIVVGSDGLAGLGFDREMELHVRAGIPASEVLQNATWNAARLMKQDSTLGSIAPGKLADLVLIEGDPIADISNMRRVKVVMKNGVLYWGADLDGALGISVKNQRPNPRKGSTRLRDRD